LIAGTLLPAFNFAALVFYLLTLYNGGYGNGKSLEELTGCPVVELLEALSRVPLKARSVQQFVKKHKNNINKM
jgi:hypothetical protein